MTSNISKGECCGLCINLGKKGERTGCTNMNCFCHQEPVGEKSGAETEYETLLVLERREGVKFIRKIRQEAFEEGVKFGRALQETETEALGSYKRGFEEGREEGKKVADKFPLNANCKQAVQSALTSLLAQIPEERNHAVDWDATGYNDALRTIRDLINNAIEK